MHTAGPILILVAGLLLWVALCYFGAVRAVRSRARQIERGSLDVPEKVHRLQRLMLASSGAMLLGYAILLAGFGVLAALGKQHHHAGQHRDSAGVIAAAIVIALSFVVVGAAGIWMIRSVRAALARVRDVPLKNPNRRRAAVGGICGALVYAAVLIGGHQLVPSHGTAHGVGLVILYMVGVVVFVTLIAPLITLRMLTRPMAPEQAERLNAVADRMKVRVRGFRVLKTRAQKVANAAQYGALPGLRYVLVTDYLVDHLPEDQLEAVVAHELGHARGHHVVKKLGVALGAWAVVEALVVGIGSAAGSSAWKGAAAGLIVLIPIGMIAAQGVLGVRLEKQADDAAARCVGRDELAGALSSIAELNDTKRDTGRVWSILTQHPGLNDRIARLTSGRRPAGAAG